MAIEKPDFEIGRSVADPIRNVVYVTDETNHKVLAVDTNSGSKIGHARLTGVTSTMAVSITGDRLFVAEPSAFKIEVFALPDLTPMPALDVGIAVYSMAHAVGDKLYVAKPGFGSFNDVWSVDATSGVVGAKISQHPGFYAGMLKSNPAGTRLYARELALSGGGGVSSFDVSNPAAPRRATTYAAPSENGRDFAVDEAARRIYTSDGGVYGVGVSNMNSGAIATWPIEPYGASVATREDSPYVYGMVSGAIQRFEKSSGFGLNLNRIAPVSGEGDSMKMTPNGRVLFHDAARFGILGRASLTINNVPLARFSTTPQGGRAFAFDGASSETYLPSQQIAAYAWDFGDGQTASGAAAAHAFASPGTYPVKLTVTTSAGLSDDYVSNVVIAGPPIEVTGMTIGAAGAAQRSAVRSLAVAFNQSVVPGAGAFELKRRNADGLFEPVANVSASWGNPSGDGKTWLASFAGSAISGGSLPDGIYTLRVAASAVSGATPAPAMAADASLTFHRLFGDGDGDGDVDNLDLFSLRSTYHKQRGDAGYKPHFDYNDDGKVDNADLFQIRGRLRLQYKGY